MAVIASLDLTTHFKKSMPSTDFPGMWQDVYNVPTPQGEAYVKIQMSLRPGSNVPLVVIQFKAK
jgi:hypothetical protein